MQPSMNTVSLVTGSSRGIGRSTILGLARAGSDVCINYLNSPREARSLDPQHRLLLEVSWEALEHAGQPVDRLAGTSTGVFVGIGIDDYAKLQLKRLPASAIDAYTGTGNAFCFAAGRLSYLLGLQGPSVALDTACSTSLSR